MREFTECRECNAKPGSPALCQSCLINRQAIQDRDRLIRKLRSVITGIKHLLILGEE